MISRNKNDEIMLMSEKISLIKGIEDRFFPTVEELKAYNIEQNIEKFLPLLLYFSQNPYSSEMEREANWIRNEYKNTISYVNSILYSYICDSID